jgi:hypothetical protein
MIRPDGRWQEYRSCDRPTGSWVFRCWDDTKVWLKILSRADAINWGRTDDDWLDWNPFYNA